MSGNGQRLGSELPSWQVAHPATCGGGAGGGFIARHAFTHSGASTEGEYTAITPSGSPVYSTAPEDYFSSLEGAKHYELKNHLGNVLATVSDKRDVEVNGSFEVESYTAKVSDASFYYPFGSLMPGLSDFGGEHRFGFQGQQKDNEVRNVNGSHIDFKYRPYNADLGRFWKVDPLFKDYPWNSSYAFSENRVIDGVDLEGREYLSKDQAMFKMYMGYPLLQAQNMSQITEIYLEKSGYIPLVSYNYMTGEVEGDPVLLQTPILHNSIPNEIEDNDEISGSIKKAGNIAKSTGYPDRRVGASVSSATPAGRALGSGVVMMVNMINYYGLTYQNCIMGDDRKKLDKQIRNYKYVSDESIFGKKVENQSLITRAYNDILSAYKRGEVTREVMQNVNMFSQLMNIVIFGGDGSESKDIKKMGDDINEKNNSRSKY